MANPDVDRLHIQERVLGWAREIYREAASLSPAGGAVVVASGSAQVWVQVASAGEDDHLIVFSSMIALKPALTPELMRHLLTLNHSELFGRFALSPEGDVILAYAAPGDIEHRQFQRVLVSMLETADQVDDAIVASWGGTRSADATGPLTVASAARSRDRFVF